MRNSKAYNGNNEKEHWKNPRIVWALDALSVHTIEAISASRASLILVLEGAKVAS